MIISYGESLQVWKILEETQVSREFVGRDINETKANKRGQFRGNFTRKLVVSDVKNLKLSAVDNLGWDAVNDLVV